MSGIVGGVGSRSGIIGIISQNIALSSGKGIDFGSSSTSAILDDYEEGSWDPTFLGATSNPEQDYHTQAGYYTKIGRQITINFDLQFNVSQSITAGSGNLRIGGLPFTNSSAGGGNEAGGSCGQYSGFSHGDSNTEHFTLGAGLNYLEIINYSGGKADASQVQLGSRTTGTVTYHI